MRDIHKHYDAVQALRGARLSVQPGRISALVGSNGSGKSTLVKVLAGLVSPNAGEILIDGQPVVIRSGNDAKALGIATAFQDLSLVPTMTVADNLLLGSEPRTSRGLVDRRQSAQAVRGQLERFRIPCDPHDYVQSLPASTQSMLEIAKAVSRRPRLLLLDEATAALHQDEIEVLFRILRELRDQGTAIVYVTHHAHEVFEICDDATIMCARPSSPACERLHAPRHVYHMTGQKMQEVRTQPDEDLGRGGEVVLRSGSLPAPRCRTYAGGGRVRSSASAV